MLIEVLIFILICLFVIAKFLKRRPRRIRFIGGRGTGKTSLLNYLMSYNYKTVPTLERYTIKYKNCTLEEVPEKDGDFLTKYSIDDPNLEYYFFIKDLEDYEILRKLIDMKKFNLKFVIVKGNLESKKEDLICLKGDLNLFKKIL